jgi:hypothetical protein
LLLDPTAEGKGSALWGGHRNWQSTPSISSQAITPTAPTQASIFREFIYWARKPEIFAQYLGQEPNPPRPPTLRAPLQVLLHLIGSEWLTVCDYITARLTQIDWEITFPEHFLKKGNPTDISLKKLHMWRRFVPLYREMISETITDAFRLPFLTSPGGAPDPLLAYKPDFKHLLTRMEEYQKRIDRLTSVVAAVISIGDARRGMIDNKNIGRLTWLATLFLPFGLIASAFSMQGDISVIYPETVKNFFFASIPLVFITMAFGYMISLPWVQERLGN